MTTPTTPLLPPGTQIWIPSPTTVWTCVTLTSHDPITNKVTYESETGPKTLILTTTPFPKNPEILIGGSDLTTLSYLHEPAVLHNLQHRFGLGTIYTWCGIVLVAINPYEEVDIYGREAILAYRGGGEGLEPHIFGVAESAFSEVARFSLNQSIIVSGESGAGKTVSAKYAMRYFATVGGSENETQIESKVLASSPLMEAVGNAKTTRNDNSSRFGKYTQLNFSSTSTPSITSASIQTYLLEKSRVTSHPLGERNYHIFYQITQNAATHSELSELFLTNSSNYHYTNQGQDTSDCGGFNETVQSLILLGFGLDSRRNFFKILAGILQLGNIEFKQGSSDEAVVSKDCPSLAKLVQLLSLDSDLLRKALTTKALKSGNEIVIKKLSLLEATYSRDALAKLIYSELFNWVVSGINGGLRKCGEGEKDGKFIGVLDIYGFETFEVNSFEQFCINYANEKLQQQFNQHVFKLEQEEYIREGISWTMIDFYDNQPCIDLIESKLGILDLLDEECKLGSGSDGSWLIKLHGRLEGKEGYVKPKIGSDAYFLIKHFADSVTYSCNGFIDKNRDLVGEGLVGTVLKNPFLTTIISPTTPTPQKTTPGKKPTTTTKPTVGSSFRTSLTHLMTSLNKTTPHYVRCIKPNDQKLPFLFDPHRAVQQLRACGVLETIRISAAGFPSRWSYVDFVNRYRMLLKGKTMKKDNPSISQVIIEQLLDSPDAYRLGKTKIFFRAGQVAYLEKLRLDKLQRAGLIIQKNIHMFAKRNGYRKMKKSAILLQTQGRGLLARRLALHHKQTRAATRIQSYYRMFHSRKEYISKLSTITKLQTIIRGYLARKTASEARNLKSITTIQSFFRGILIRRQIAAQRKRIILAQSCIRRFLAKKRLRKLKLEARSLQHVQATNKGLENKIISLQQRIEGLNKDKKALDSVKEENSSLKSELVNYKQLQKSFKELEQRLITLEEDLLTNKGQYEQEKISNFNLINENDKIKEQMIHQNKEHELQNDLITDLRQKILDLESEINKLNEYKERCDLLEQELDLERRKYMENVKGGFAGPASLVNTVPSAAPRTSLLEKRVLGLEEENGRLKIELGRLLGDPSSGDLKGVGGGGETSSLLLSEKQAHSLLQDKYNTLLSSLSTSPSTITQQLTKLTLENEQLRQKLTNEVTTDEESVNFHVVKKKNVLYLGMLEYKQEDLDRILRALITDLPPTLALSTTPIKSLPSYLLFMLIRYTDYINDDDRVRTLLTKAINNIKRLIRKRGQDNVDLLILWFCNIIRLLHTLKQYGGDASFQKENTQRQNEQCLKNFDLYEYRQVLSDHAVWVYTLLIKSLEDTFQSLIVPGILESTSDTTTNSRKPLDILINQLEQTYNLLDSFGMDSSIVHQIFKQLFYYICAGALNNLLLRRELCHWSKGVDIRFNISGIQEWTHAKKMDSAQLLPLAPLIQASQILQARKTDKDVGNLCEICDDLSVQQVTKLLNLYSSKDGLDSDKVSKTLIAQVQEKLTNQRLNKPTSSSLLMDTKFSFAVKFDFNPSNIRLEEIVIPEGFGLGGVVKML